MYRSACTRSRRAGSALALLLGLIMVLSAFGGIVQLLSHGAYKEVDEVNNHLRAVGVGEVCFAEIIARLSTAPWGQRGFRGGPEVRTGLSAIGGSYGYLLRDTPAPAASTDPAKQ